MYKLPETGYLRLWHIIGRDEITEEQAEVNRERNKEPSDNGKRRAYPTRPRESSEPLIPIGKTAWWEGVKEGKFPQPVKLSPRVTVWRAEDIRALIEKGVG